LIHLGFFVLYFGRYAIWYATAGWLLLDELGSLWTSSTISSQPLNGSSWARIALLSASQRLQPVMLASRLTNIGDIAAVRKVR
jgi:hypothetical protein